MGESYRIAFRMKASCEHVTAFRFDRPEGYAFQAGQYFRLTLETAEGEQTRTFSHASASRDPFLELATRLTGSAFKNALDQLRRGDVVTIAGPYGRLVASSHVREACFLAGGVGIAPARSMIRDAEQQRTGLRMKLFYGNKDQTCIPYAAEFAEYERKDRRFQYVHVLEEPFPGWQGERGFISADILRRHMDPLAGWHYYISGPPPMIVAMRRVLEELSISPDAISVEEFAGYAASTRP